jgi:endonuclease YncB( thermonuclease family)
MAVPGFRAFFGIALLLAGVAPAAAQDRALCGGKPVPVRIAEVLDGASFKLADGRIIRLATVIAPLPIDGDEQAIARAKTVLHEIANERDAIIYLSSDSKDRYGRVSAQSVFVDGKIWLEAEMLSRGSVRVFHIADDKCAKALLQHEARARATQAGLWSDAKFGVFDAGNVEALLAAQGRFVVVEGTVRRVGDARGRLYLDFGRRYTEDFTIIASDALRKRLVAQGVDPKRWRGQRIRVRGILFSWGGPAIEVNLAPAIELLDLPKSE